MKKVVIMLVMIMLVSCGKKEYTTIVESDFDDSTLRSKLVLQDARIGALEDRLNGLGTELELQAKLALIDELSNRDKITIESLCGTREMVLKVGNTFYGVISSITNLSLAYNVHIGAIPENTLYQTTEGTNSRFKVLDGKIVCQ